MLTSDVASGAVMDPSCDDEIESNCAMKAAAASLSATWQPSPPPSSRRPSQSSASICRGRILLESLGSDRAALPQEDSDADSAAQAVATSIVLQPLPDRSLQPEKMVSPRPQASKLRMLNLEAKVRSAGVLSAPQFWLVANVDVCTARTPHPQAIRRRAKTSSSCESSSPLLSVSLQLEGTTPEVVKSVVGPLILKFLWIKIIHRINTVRRHMSQCHQELSRRKAAAVVRKEIKMYIFKRNRCNAAEVLKRFWVTYDGKVKKDYAADAIKSFLIPGKVSLLWWKMAAEIKKRTKKIQRNARDAAACQKARIYALSAAWFVAERNRSNRTPAVTDGPPRRDGASPGRGGAGGEAILKMTELRPARRQQRNSNRERGSGSKEKVTIKMEELSRGGGGRIGGPTRRVSKKKAKVKVKEKRKAKTEMKKKANVNANQVKNFDAAIMPEFKEAEETKKSVVDAFKVSTCGLLSWIPANNSSISTYIDSTAWPKKPASAASPVPVPLHLFSTNAGERYEILASHIRKSKKSAIEKRDRLQGKDRDAVIVKLYTECEHVRFNSWVNEAVRKGEKTMINDKNRH